MGITLGKSRIGSRRDSSQSTTISGKIGATLFFLFFFAMGTAFCVFLAIAFFQNLGTYTWLATNATITHSTIERDRNGDYRLDVRYRYVVANRAYTASSYDDPSGRDHTSDDRAALERLAAKYFVGAECTAYVHPSDPSRAILARPGLWIGLMTLFPLVFVALGAGGIYFVWFGNIDKKQSVTARGSSKRASGKWILRGMGVVFVIVGLIVTYLMLLLPLVRVHRAKSWMPVPATVIASRVVTHHGDDSTTYSVDILYEYDMDGRTLRNNRYHFMTGSSSGRDAKQKIVDAHPPGKAITAYVNPADPFEAVIERGYPEDLWFGLIPLVFLAAGAGMFVGSFFINARRRRADGMTWLPSTASEEQVMQPFFRQSVATHGRVKLRASTSPFGKLIGIILGAVLWNSITGVFVTIAVKSHLNGNPEWFLTFFIIPFVLIGIGFLGGIVYQCLALLNPSPVLEVNTATPMLGETLTVDWRLQGRVGRIATLTLSLVGEEQATYRRGTNTVTDKHAFYDETILETSDLAEIFGGGRLETLIPADVMHSLDADNNKIVWSLKAVGDIKRWPDMKAEFLLVVRPLDPETISHA